MTLVLLLSFSSNVSAFTLPGGGGSGGDQENSSKAKEPLSKKPSPTDCIKRGCAGGPLLVTKPDGTKIWTCGHCRDGNSCNSQRDCKHGLICNEDKRCTPDGEETKCKTSRSEELAAIKAAIKKAYDEMKAEGIDPCSANLGNILKYYGASNSTMRCDQINPLGEKKLEAICEASIGTKGCHFSIRQGFSDGTVSDHQFICVVDNSKPVPSGKDPECAKIIDFWDGCDDKTGPPLLDPKDFRFPNPGIL